MVLVNVIVFGVDFVERELSRVGGEGVDSDTGKIF